MGFFDWIKNRQAGQQQSVANTAQAEKPETAKQMYTRQAAEEKANAKPLEPQISQAHHAEAKDAGRLFDKATQQLQQSPSSQPSAPSDGAGSPEPMRQKMMNQDQSSPALSPTSAQKGTPATEKSAATPSNEPPAKQPEKSAPQRPQTVPRRPPSWER
jgi:hypothetical protein